MLVADTDELIKSLLDFNIKMAMEIESPESPTASLEELTLDNNVITTSWT